MMTTKSINKKINELGIIRGALNLALNNKFDLSVDQKKCIYDIIDDIELQLKVLRKRLKEVKLQKKIAKEQT